MAASGEYIYEYSRPKPTTSDAKTYRFLVLGRTGEGKSSICNLLLGREIFKTSAGVLSETTACQKFTIPHAGGRMVHVIDSPGLCDTKGKDADQEILKNIAVTLADSSEGINQILLIISKRLTPESLEAINTIFKVFLSTPKCELINMTTIIRTNTPDFENPKFCAEQEGILRKKHPLFQKARKFIFCDVPPKISTDSTSLANMLAEQNQKKSLQIIMDDLLTCEQVVKPPSLEQIEPGLREFAEAAVQVERLAEKIAKLEQILEKKDELFAQNLKMLQRDHQADIERLMKEQEEKKTEFQQEMFLRFEAENQKLKAQSDLVIQRLEEQLQAQQESAQKQIDQLRALQEEEKARLELQRQEALARANQNETLMRQQAAQFQQQMMESQQRFQSQISQIQNEASRREREAELRFQSEAAKYRQESAQQTALAQQKLTETLKQQSLEYERRQREENAEFQLQLKANQEKFNTLEVDLKRYEMQKQTQVNASNNAFKKKKNGGMSNVIKVVGGVASVLASVAVLAPMA